MSLNKYIAERIEYLLNIDADPVSIYRALDLLFVLEDNFALKESESLNIYFKHRNNLILHVKGENLAFCVHIPNHGQPEFGSWYILVMEDERVVSDCPRAISTEVELIANTVKPRLFRAGI